MSKNSFSAEKLGRKTAFKQIEPSEISEMTIIINRLKALGIETANRFSDVDSNNSSDSEDEHIAKICIYSGKAVPEDVEQRLLDKLYAKNNIKHTVTEINISDTDIEEFLNRAIDSNAENFKLFGVKDKSTGKLVSDITNPRHKYWESEKRAQSAINGYNPIYVTQRDRKKHNKEDLEVVEIKCVVQEK